MRRLMSALIATTISVTAAHAFGVDGERWAPGSISRDFPIDLRAGAAQIKVSYSALPTGAEIAFETTDLHLLTAIHRWFDAQLSEHGADATSE